MKSNIETKMELMERRQAVHANKIQALMLMITAMQIPEKEKNRNTYYFCNQKTTCFIKYGCCRNL